MIIESSYQNVASLPPNTALANVFATRSSEWRSSNNTIFVSATFYSTTATLSFTCIDLATQSPPPNVENTHSLTYQVNSNLFVIQTPSGTFSPFILCFITIGRDLRGRGERNWSRVSLSRRETHARTIFGARIAHYSRPPSFGSKVSSQGHHYAYITVSVG